MPTHSPSPHLPFGENKEATWYGKDIISVKQFTRGDLQYTFGVAHLFLKKLRPGPAVPLRPPVMTRGPM